MVELLSALSKAGLIGRSVERIEIPRSSLNTIQVGKSIFLCYTFYGQVVDVRQGKLWKHLVGNWLLKRYCEAENLGFSNILQLEIR
jgi:hypothetical protein